MGEIACPLCGKKEGCSQQQTPNWFEMIHCATFNFDCAIDEEILGLSDGNENKERVLDLIVEHLLRYPFCEKGGTKYKWVFFSNPNYEKKESDKAYFYNLADKVAAYPITTVDIANRALMNLSVRFPRYGDLVHVDWSTRRVLFEHDADNLVRSGILLLLSDLGLIKEDTGFSGSYRITAKGWEKIEAQQKKNQEVKQCFIAMSFHEEAKQIRDAFRKACSDLGYTACIMDEKEHNNQIMPEVFYEIQRSKFLVVDVTFPSYGAYYEAGYGLALGKQVIICCRKAEAESDDKNVRPHFDISQQSLVLWEDYDDLLKKLKSRIVATVG